MAVKGSGGSRKLCVGVWRRQAWQECACSGQPLIVSAQLVSEGLLLVVLAVLGVPVALVVLA